MQLNNTYFFLLLITLSIISCNSEERKNAVKKEAQKEIVERDSIDAQLKAHILNEEFKKESITKNVNKIKMLSVLNESLSITDLSDTLKRSDDFTLFAPTDKAFIKEPRKSFATKKAKKTALLQKVRYHIVGDEWSSHNIETEILENEGEFQMVTLNGKKLEASLKGEDIILRDVKGNNATVIETDIDASNGTIHIIDAVLTSQ